MIPAVKVNFHNRLDSILFDTPSVVHVSHYMVNRFETNSYSQTLQSCEKEMKIVVSFIELADIHFY